MRAFTLVEIIVVFLLMTIIMGGIFFALYTADLTRQIDMGLADLQQSLRQVIDGMTKELRQTRAANLIIDAAQTAITFTIPGSANSIRYYMSGNQILREHPIGANAVLANDISALNFCCLDGADCFDCTANVLRINITANKTVRNRPLTLGITEKVRLRNE